MSKPVVVGVLLFGVVWLVGAEGVSGAEPEQVVRYREVFHVAEAVSGRVWNEPVPFGSVPVLAYAPAGDEEYLINFPRPEAKGYEPTGFEVNGKPVLVKKGELTFKFPGGKACALIDGVPVVTMGYGLETTLEQVIQTFIHEGFHYFQFGPLYEVGIGDFALSLPQATFVRGPRTAAYDEDLVVEARALCELLAPADEGDREQFLRELIAIETQRRSKLSTAAAVGEDFLFVAEGTAAYVELEALRILTEEGVQDSTIPDGTLPGYTYFEGEQSRQTYEANLAHFGTRMLENKINLPSTAAGEITYRYALALVRVLQKHGSRDGAGWQRGIFPLLPEERPEGEIDRESFLRHLTASSLSRRVAALRELSSHELVQAVDRARNRILSEDDIRLIEEKVRIEAALPSYSFGDGWAYEIDAAGFLMTYFDQLQGRMYSDRGLQSSLYLMGLHKLETADKRLVIEKITAPIVSNMFRGTIRFKDTSASSGNPRIDCTADGDEVCSTLELVLEGLELRAKNVSVRHDRPNRKTIIRLLRE